MSARTSVPRDLPEWAKAEVGRAVQYVIHPTDDAFKAELRRVPGYQAARREIIAHLKRLEPIIGKLSRIDREHVSRMSAPLLTLAAEWERRSLRTPSPPKKGRPQTSAGRDELFHAIVDRLVADGWTRAAGLNALGTYIVQAFPPIDGTGKRVNGHVYGTLSSGYGKRANRKTATTRQREANWQAIPISDQALKAFIARLRSSRTTRRNK